MTSRWQISIHANVDKADAYRLQSCKWMNQCAIMRCLCAKTHIHIHRHTSVAWLHREWYPCSLVLCLWDMFSFIRRLQRITMTRIQNHYTLFYRKTPLTEALWGMSVSLLEAFRRLKCFCPCSTIWTSSKKKRDLYGWCHNAGVFWNIATVLLGGKYKLLNVNHLKKLKLK